MIGELLWVVLQLNSTADSPIDWRQLHKIIYKLAVNLI